MSKKGEKMSYMVYFPYEKNHLYEINATEFTIQIKVFYEKNKNILKCFVQLFIVCGTMYRSHNQAVNFEYNVIAKKNR